MRITATCCCGADLTLDSGGSEDTWVLDRVERQMSEWNLAHAVCSALRATKAADDALPFNPYAN